MTGYCVRCRSKTQDKNPHIKHTSNGRQMIQSSCGRCGTRKCHFISNKGTSTGVAYKTNNRKNGKRKNSKLKGGGPFGSMLGAILGSAAGGYAGGPAGLAVGSQIGNNLGDLLPF